MRALVLLIVIIGAITLAIYAIWRWRKRILHEERRAAWHAKREEEDRIWDEKINKR